MKDQAIKHFILVFDHRKGELIDQREFGTDSQSAVREYAEQEKRFRDDELIDIVLVGSDSIETVKHTHANYFDGSASLSKEILAYLDRFTSA